MRLRRNLSRLVFSLAVLACGGCQGFWSVAETDGTLEDSMRTYTKLVRWGELERASLFVDEAQRAEFVALSAGFDRLRFTDFDMGPVEFTHEGDQEVATVTVVYRAYDVNTLVERTIVETQRWSAGGSTRFKVVPDLSGFREALGGVAAGRREPAG